MSVVRRFLVVPALARLIRKERGGSKISEGYFAPQGGRTSLVRIDGQQCHLVLINSGADGASNEERTEVPRAHGDALLDVCGGKATYERTTVALSPGRDALIDRYVTPAGLDLISVAFEDDNASKAFRAPNWFGPEVTDNAAYERHAVALQGVPEPARFGLNNAMLDAVLDLLEPRFGMGRYGSGASAPKPADEEPAARRTFGTNGSAPARPAEPIPAKDVSEAASPVAASAAALAGHSAPVVESETDGEQPKTVRRDAPETDKAAEIARAQPGHEAKADGSADGGSSPESAKGDARIDDVIESLSQALGAAIQQPQEPARSSDDLAASFERWTVRPRRTQQ